MIELLTQAAEDHPDHLAVVSPFGQVTYRELAVRAHAAAQFFAGRGVTRVGVLDPDPAVVLAILAGASRIGVEACVYPLAADRGRAAEYAADFGHELLITAQARHDVPVASPAEVFATDPSIALDEPPTSRPILILTTGTTGHQRGVRHEWDRLLRASQRIVAAPDQRWLLAYGLNQFGGLQILLHVLAARATLVFGETFQPKDALKASREWGVTHASGTPTFWRFLLALIKSDGLDPPDFHQVTLGGEAVPTALLHQIREMWPKAKVSQIYGATEFGQNITVRDGLPGLPLSVLESDGDVQFTIVDGELHVRSRASMVGYHGEDPIDPDQWRATGDLVEVVGDRVEFRGRRNDIINVGGVKVHPLPVEERVSLVPGVAAARAFGRKNALTGAIVAVELVLDPGYIEDEVDALVRQACEDLPPAARPRSIRFVESITTTGNKMSRGAP